MPSTPRMKSLRNGVVSSRSTPTILRNSACGDRPGVRVMSAEANRSGGQQAPEPPLASGHLVLGFSTRLDVRGQDQVIQMKRML
jgi:hypothetical protein